MTENRLRITPDPDLAEEAVWYRGKLEEYLHAAQEGVNTRDNRALETIGHRMKGSAKSFGFDLAGEMGKKLELAAKKNDMDAIKPILASLAEYLDRVEIVID